MSIYEDLYLIRFSFASMLAFAEMLEGFGTGGSHGQEYICSKSPMTNHNLVGEVACCDARIANTRGPLNGFAVRWS
jgi:hypothetical protein